MRNKIAIIGLGDEVYLSPLSLVKLPVHSNPQYYGPQQPRVLAAGVPAKVIKQIGL
ncbi:MAG: hypothetical protein HOA84_04320 [Candidatus Jacksonbacteria bacterium]|nr:hypothetical protein [Candidatus Jacksonbacteria bacterium]